MDKMREPAFDVLTDKLLGAIFETIDRAGNFAPTLEKLRSTLEAIDPILQQIEKYNAQLSLPKQETDRMVKLMEIGEKLVRKCCKIPWWDRFFSASHYQQQLEELDKALVRFFHIDMLAQMARDVKQLSLIVKNIQMEIGDRNMVGPCTPPPPPDFTVGLDVPLREIKVQLLKDGSSVIVLTACGGMGKTALAKKLCWDKDVQGKFSENIFFVVFSKTPNLKNIVKNMYQQHGVCVPEFQSDEDAMNQLRNFLKQIGRSPVLLVLDDVWSRSDYILRKFVFQMSDYKILVTSRFTFRNIGIPYELKSLKMDDAKALFHHTASLDVSRLNFQHEQLAGKIVKRCGGSPLALELIGGLLCEQPIEIWQSKLDGHSILDSNEVLLDHLLEWLEVLGNKSILKECFMDLGLFPEDQKIPATALIDMWVELHKLGEDGASAMAKIYELTKLNLAKVFVNRTITNGAENYYNDCFVVQHDLLRELAIHQCSQEAIEERKRLVVNISGSDFPEWWTNQKLHKVAARILSISTDESFESNWCNLQTSEAEVLVLNVQTDKYCLPPFIKTMRNLKVLIMTNYGYNPTELKGFESLAYLSSLRRIRLEYVSLGKVHFQLENLQKLSLFMCKVGEAFQGHPSSLSVSLPNLVEINIAYCNDMVELPAGLCDSVNLKTLRISNCHELSKVPEEIGKLEALEELRLCSCTDLEELPDSIAELSCLNLLDISDCISLSMLPEDIGNLCNLRKLFLSGCSRLSELPSSVTMLKSLRELICDEETSAMWQYYKSDLEGLSIHVPKQIVNLDWLRR